MQSRLAPKRNRSFHHVCCSFDPLASRATARDRLLAPTSAPPPNVDRQGHPYSTTDQPAKPVESSGVARGTLGSTLKLVRMGDRKGSPLRWTNATPGFRGIVVVLVGPLPLRCTRCLTRQQSLQKGEHYGNEICGFATTMTCLSGGRKAA